MSTTSSINVQFDHYVDQLNKDSAFTMHDTANTNYL